MYCSNCGQELAPEAKFCSNCGAPVQSGASTAGAQKSPQGTDRDWGGYSTGEAPQTPEPTTTPPDQPYTDDGFASDRKPIWEVERERLRESAVDEWSMSSIGEPPPRRRRIWLWVLLGMIGLIIIACCVGIWWITSTDAGIEWAEGVIATGEAMVTATAEASPEP